MKHSIAHSFFVLFVGVLIGASLSARLGIAQEYRPSTGYANLWNKASDTVKLTYLIGYSDAEQMYRFAIDRQIQPLSSEEGKKSIASFEYHFPMPTGSSLAQEKQGIDEFYKDWRNQSIDLITANNIVRMQLVGRTQSEVEDYLARAKASQNEK